MQILTEIIVSLAIGLLTCLFSGAPLGLLILISILFYPFVVHNSMNDSIPYIDGVTETEPWIEN